MIDPKTIEEWKSACEPGRTDLTYRSAAYSALPALLAEREELLAKIAEMQDEAANDTTVIKTVRDESKRPPVRIPDPLT